MSRVTYQEAETYISELPKFTKKNTLEHTQKFLSFLGNPQNGKKVIHVAGTNGKGSVCVYLDAMLRAQRKHTGLFTSPHLIRMNERIRMDGEPVSDETFTRLFLRTQQSVRRMEAEGLPHPSFFEFLFGMAMAGFEEAGVEYVILETGLGGRLDATNSISGPLTCILTSIGLDHTEILGNTLEEIAAEILEDEGLRQEARALKEEVYQAIEAIGKTKTEEFGEIYAYETDGYGMYNLMDDANVPSLLSMSYLGYPADQEIADRTRKFLLSEANPYYFEGSAAAGIGSGHTPSGYIWHIALAMQGLTETDQKEKEKLLDMLTQTTGGKGMMHEGFCKDDPTRYTREWFSWANAMYAELFLDYFGYRLRV